MQKLTIDFETRSVVDLREVGLHNYMRHASTEPWCMAWALDDAEPKIWQLYEPCPPPVVAHITTGKTIIAHNCTFEIEVINELLVPCFDWPQVHPAQFEDTMAASYAMGLPGALEDAAMALGLPVQKDMEGRALVLRMARPRSMAEGKPVWWDDPDRIQRAHAYCAQDVRVTRELHKRLMPLGERERRIWRMDYAINRRGIKLDVPSARASVELAERAAQDCDARIAILTGGEVSSTNALIPLKQWLKKQDPGHAFSALDKEAVNELLKEEIQPQARAALLLRQEAGKASTAKLGPMLAIAGADDRMRGLLQYHGATTGRWAGRKIQPHNFPRDSYDADDAERILEWIRSGNDAAIDLVYDRPLTAISRCLKAFLIPAEGRIFNVGDWSSIEGRGTAWVSGEEWKLELFRKADRGEGPDAYVQFAAKALRIPVDQVTKAQRQKPGKVGELAFGYQGGVGAARRFGAIEPDDVVEGWKNDWRAAHPKIVAAWATLEQGAITAIENPDKVYSILGGKIKFRKAGSFLWCRLPSGRALCYPYPELRPGKFGKPMVTYMAVPSPDDRKKKRIIEDPRNAPRWARLSTYGGSLMENVVQALCRDILADKLVAFADAGWRTVLHVHDEIINEEASDRTAEMDAIMCAPLDWCPGFPLHAECGALRRYGKP